MGNIIRIIGIVVVASLTVNASAVSWQDDFNGPNGTIVAPGTDWGYTNLGVELADWNVHPRPDANDQYYITNNQLYCYVGPCTNDPSVYNKVMCNIYPQTNGSPLHVNIAEGELKVQWDLIDMQHNDGHKWENGQEIKITVSPIPFTTDPHYYKTGQGPTPTNFYEVQIKIGPSSIAERYTLKVSNANATGKYSTIKKMSVSNAFFPTTISFIQKGNGSFTCYTNDAEFASIPDATVIQDAYIQIWHGMFNGDGSMSSTGHMIIDNFNIGQTPKPDLNIIGNNNFGIVLTNVTKLRTFTIENSGAAPLYLSGDPSVKVSGTGFSIIGQPSVTNLLAFGSNTTFELQFYSLVSGIYTGMVSIVNNSTSNPYNYAVYVDCRNALPGVDINVTGTTDFGNVYTSACATNSFIISNSGTLDLILSGVPAVVINKAEFNIIQPALTNIPSGSNTTFDIIFCPMSVGAITGTVSIANNDSDKNPYQIEVTGTGVPEPCCLLFIVYQILFINYRRKFIPSAPASRD